MKGLVIKIGSLTSLIVLIDHDIEENERFTMCEFMINDISIDTTH